jgi:hypothetical protein
MTLLFWLGNGTGAGATDYEAHGREGRGAGARAASPGRNQYTRDRGAVPAPRLVPTTMERGESQRGSLSRCGWKWSLNDGQTPNFRGVRVHVSTGHSRGERNERVLRNGRVSDLPSEIPTVTIRNFCIAVPRALAVASVRRMVSEQQACVGTRPHAARLCLAALACPSVGVTLERSGARTQLRKVKVAEMQSVLTTVDTVSAKDV